MKELIASFDEWLKNATDYLYTAKITGDLRSIKERNILFIKKGMQSAICVLFAEVLAKIISCKLHKEIFLLDEVFEKKSSTESF